VARAEDKFYNHKKGLSRQLVNLAYALHSVGCAFGCAHGSDMLTRTSNKEN
jgi:hypothetical protein